MLTPLVAFGVFSFAAAAWFAAVLTLDGIGFDVPGMAPQLPSFARPADADKLYEDRTWCSDEHWPKDSKYRSLVFGTNRSFDEVKASLLRQFSIQGWTAENSDGYFIGESPNGETRVYYGPYAGDPEGFDAQRHSGTYELLIAVSVFGDCP